MKWIGTISFLSILCWAAIWSKAYVYTKANYHPFQDSLLLDTTLHHFKEIESGKVVRHSFRLTNQYGKTLYLEFLEKSCNCTKVKMEKRKLEAGETGYVELIVDTKGKCGDFYSYALIKANTSQKYYKIGVKGNVINCD